MMAWSKPSRYKCGATCVPVGVKSESQPSSLHYPVLFLLSGFCGWRHQLGEQKVWRNPLDPKSMNWLPVNERTLTQKESCGKVSWQSHLPRCMDTGIYLCWTWFTTEGSLYNLYCDNSFICQENPKPLQYFSCESWVSASWGENRDKTESKFHMTGTVQILNDLHTTSSWVVIHIEFVYGV